LDHSTFARRWLLLGMTAYIALRIVKGMSDPILIAKAGKNAVELLPQMANRHGLIAGATGTGKTVTLQALAENFSARGVPVFMADVKGDLAGMSRPGGNTSSGIISLVHRSWLATTKKQSIANRLTKDFRRAQA
jgi:Bacterial protein of unknown function (DUF853)